MTDPELADPGPDVDADEPVIPPDGRVARRQRNIDVVLDVVLELFAEDSLFPTMEQAAQRSGLSLRSLYRYFADPAALLEASIQRSRRRSAALARLHAIGEGPLERRIDDFVTMRLRLYEARAAEYRATVANAPRHRRIGDELSRVRDDLRSQFERQFAPELAARRPAEGAAALSAGDLLTQLDSIDYLRTHRQLSPPQVEADLASALRSLLG